MLQKGCRCHQGACHRYPHQHHGESTDLTSSSTVKLSDSTVGCRFPRTHGFAWLASTRVSAKYLSRGAIQVGLELPRTVRAFLASGLMPARFLPGTTGTKLVNYVVSDRVIRSESFHTELFNMSDFELYVVSLCVSIDGTDISCVVFNPPSLRSPPEMQNLYVEKVAYIPFAIQVRWCTDSTP